MDVGKNKPAIRNAKDLACLFPREKISRGLLKEPFFSHAGCKAKLYFLAAALSALSLPSVVFPSVSLGLTHSLM